MGLAWRSKLDENGRLSERLLVVGEFPNSLQNFDERLNFVELIDAIVVVLGAGHDLLELDDGLSLLLELRINDVLHAEGVVFLDLHQGFLVLGFVV